MENSSDNALGVLERTNVKLRADLVVAGTVSALQVEHKLFTLRKNGHKSAAGRVILGMLLQVSSQL
jgi:hypothetical protein